MQIGQLASDANNPQFAGATDPDAVLHVVFYIRAVQNNFESAKQQKPVFQDELFVKISAPGNNLNVIDRPADDRDKARFPKQWLIFQNTQGHGEQVTGMPLTEWTFLSKSRVEELRARKFFTVEQIAGASDLQTQSMGMDGMTLREKARVFLANAAKAADAQAKADENQALKTQLAEQDAKHQREMDELRTLLKAATTPKQKRAYNKKPKVEAPPG